MLSEEALVQIKQDGYTAEALAPYREASVLGLVRQLADAMTSDDANARTAAVGFLWRACLTGDAKHYQRRADFDAAAVDAVVKFLAEKALTYATADEAYEGLAAIVSKYLPLMQPATVEFLCTEWLPAAGLQRQGVKSRQRGLAVLKALASTHGRTMGAGGDLVARGLLAAVDEERDPSNVMTAFTVNALLTPHFSAQTMQAVGEDLFDSLAVYFPILFTPPQGCPVTKADLREALHMALASPAYAEYALTFLCNKLASPSSVTKTEALDVMRRCIQPLLNDHAAPAKRAAYLATLRQSYPETFVALRSEVLRLSAMGEHGDPELLQAVLRMLCDLTASVRHLHQEDLLGSLKPIVDAAVSTIEGGSPAGRAYATMLHAVASAAPSVCRTIFEYTVPLVCAIASEPSPKPNQVDGAAAIVAAVTAAAERCFAAGTPVPAPRAEALEAATDFIALLRRRAFDSATASLSVASGIETTSTLSVLGTLDSAWLAEEAVVDNYRELAQLSTTRHNEVGACAAKALANAMRVDRKFAPAVLKEEAARAAADPKALLQCAAAVAEIPDAEAQDLSLGLVLMLLDRTPTGSCGVTRGTRSARRLPALWNEKRRSRQRAPSSAATTLRPPWALRCRPCKRCCSGCRRTTSGACTQPLTTMTQQPRRPARPSAVICSQQPRRCRCPTASARRSISAAPPRRLSAGGWRWPAMRPTGACLASSWRTAPSPSGTSWGHASATTRTRRWPPSC
jgi:hypothetical protein